MRYFRRHRGSFEESIKTKTVISSISDIRDIIKKELGINIDPSDIEVEYYGFDKRLGEDTYIIRLKEVGIVGWTNGEL